MRDLSGAEWRKSIRSGQTGDCVEVATNLRDIVPVRDTKDRHEGTLVFPHATWAVFITDLKAGAFDL